jgi:phage gp29-like protein
VWWWCAANFTSDWLLNLAQLFGIPFRWVEYDPMMPAPLKAELDNMLQNMGSAGYGRFPTGVKLNFIEGGKGSEHSPQANLLDRADRYARLIVLGQTLTGNTGSGKGGGLAFGKMEAQVKDVMMEAAGEYACSVINNQLIPSILRLNYDDDSARPTMRLLDKEEGTPDDAKRDTTLAAAGLKIGVNFLRKKYGIPAPEVGQETIGPDTMAKEPGKNLLTEGNKGNQGAEDGADLAARGRGRRTEDGGQKDILLEALRTEFASLNKRLEAISQIQDAEVQKAKLNSVLLELDKFEADLHHDPEVARAIYKILVQGVGNGMAEAAQERT